MITNALIMAIIAIESGGDPNAIGPCQERGLMQIREATWRDMTDEPYSRAFEAGLNREVGEKYLRWIAAWITKNQGKPATTEQVLSAYNGGIGNLRKHGWRPNWCPAVGAYVAKVKAARR